MMDNAQLATASLNDIVFEGRNKSYGAYELRRIYGRHVTRALIIGAALLMLLVLVPAVAKYLEDHKPKEKLDLRTIDLMEPPPVDETQPPPPPPPPATPPAPPPVEPPAVKQVRFTPPVVERNEKVQKVEEVPDQKELVTQNVGAKTVEKGLDAPPDLSGLQGQGTEKAAVAEVVPDAKVYTFVEQMPSLPGGGGTAAIVKAIENRYATRPPTCALKPKARYTPASR